jgi:hypothetical protein
VESREWCNLGTPAPQGWPAVRRFSKKAGHWVHHDQLDLFLRESYAFLASSVWGALERVPAAICAPATP